MQGKRIAWCNVCRKRRKPDDQLGSGDEVQSGRSQRGHLQRLADVASSFPTIRMVVEDAGPCCEIQQHGACKRRQRPARNGLSEDRPTPSHDFPD